MTEVGRQVGIRVGILGHIWLAIIRKNGKGK